MTRRTNMEHVSHLQRMANEAWIGSPERAALDAAIAALSAPSAPVGVEGLARGVAEWVIASLVDLTDDYANMSTRDVVLALLDNREHAPALAQQPAYDGGFTAADMMDARQEGRKEAQQPAAVDEADAKDAEIARLQDEIANRWAQGVHTCHDNCQRIACVQRREMEALRAEREVIVAEAVKYADKSGRLEARAERLAEALRWYAEQAALCRKLGADGDGGRQALDADGGKRAYDALRDHDQEGGNP